MRITKISFQKAFGAHLRKLRNKKGMTQEQLAAKAKIPQSQVGRIEIGAINTSVFTLAILARALGVHKKDLLNF